MSVWRYVFDSELFQRMDIESLRATSRSMSHRMARAQMRDSERVEELEQDVGELALLCRALVSVLKERGGIDDAALQEALQRIDLEDGVVDGRVTPEDERPAPPKPPSQFGPAPTPSRFKKRP